EGRVVSSPLRVVSSQLSVLSPSPTADEKATVQTEQARTQLTTDNRELRTEHTYPHWPWTWPIQALRVLWIELVMRPLVWFLAAPRVTYVSNPTHDGKAVMDGPPALLISNHVTAYDGALVLYALPFKLRHRVAAAMSGEMLADMRSARNQGNFLLNLLAPGAYYLLTALFNVFPLPRARGFRRSFAHAGEAMDHGYSVLIFPEGTRSRDGKLHAFRPGIGLLAQQSRAPILPIAIRGLYELTTTHTRWFRSGRIEVRAGALIPAADETTDPAALSATLEQAVRALL
ncbi:MAG TPA: lysophospholipid acyltransferase family protein, partial [Acidobacteriaceae bacterium]